MTPQVSVITPFFNAAPFFEEAIESVLAQTCPDWELLLVDDGSTDGSTEIARAYADSYPHKIFYVEHPGHANLGTSAAVNLGIRHARASRLALLDADDVWLPQKLAVQLPLLDAHPEAGMVYGNSLFWHSWTGELADTGRDFAPPLGVPLDRMLAPPELLIRCLRGQAAVPCTCSVLLRRDVVERVGGFEESFQVMFSDQAFYAKMLLAAPVFVASGIHDKYRIHPNSTVARAKRAGEVRAGRARYLQFVARYLDHQPMADTVRRVVREQQRRHRYPRIAALLDRARPRLRRRLRPLGGPRFGNLRRVVPVSREFGLDRGRPIDRHYIEHFLDRHRDEVAGRVLEIGDDSYTRRFGGARVTRSDVLNVQPGHPKTTIVADLAAGDHIPSETFDCIILTQTLQLIFDLPAAMRTLHRILKPGGVLLATMPGITQLHGGRWKDTWYWSFTPASTTRLFVEAFGPEQVSVHSHGNVLAACAFLQGLACDELAANELDANDPLYPLLLTVRAQKA
jgi:glycosyltransferase involved in cell wall biosynthesis